MIEVESPDELPIFAKNLRELRLQKGWSQRAVAEAMQELGFPGVYQSTVSRFEMGTQEPRLVEAQALTYLFGVTIDDALGNLKTAEITRDLKHLVPDLERQFYELVDAADSFARRREAIEDRLKGMSEASFSGRQNVTTLQVGIRRKAEQALANYTVDKADKKVRKNLGLR